METVEINREEANKLMVSSNCRFGVVSEGSTVWACGYSKSAAIKNARRYFWKNKRDFNFDYSETKTQFVDRMMESCWVVEVF